MASSTPTRIARHASSGAEGRLRGVEPTHSAPSQPVPGATTVLHDPIAGEVVLYAAPRSEPASGPPLLLVHTVNAAASAYEIRPLYERLATVRPTYALDLPGYGLSERSDREYSPRIMTDAIVAAVAEIRAAHGGAAIDALAVSLSCEFLARAASEDRAAFRTVALVSPTGMMGTRRFDGPEGSDRGIGWVRTMLRWRWLGPRMFRWLTRPRVVHYFLRKTYGGPDVDPGLFEYAVHTAAQPGAHHAPLCFLSAQLFSADITLRYEELTMPVWIAHGTRGDFVDYRGADSLAARPNWTRTVYESGALPYFEQPEAFVAEYRGFLDRAG